MLAAVITVPALGREIVVDLGGGDAADVDDDGVQTSQTSSTLRISSFMVEESQPAPFGESGSMIDLDVTTESL